jgi:RecT family
MSTFVPFPLAKYRGKLLFMKTQSPNFSAEQIGLLRRNLCRELSEDDFALFVQACERTGLDPFARHIYPMPRFVWRDRRQETTHYPEVSIDGLRACAERTGNYAGQLGPEWCGPDGEWKDIWLGDDPKCESAKLRFREIPGSNFRPEYLRLPAGSRGGRPVPPQLQGFVARATERKTVIAALKYLHDEMLAVAGIEGGRIFQRMTLRIPRTFPTREACAAANVECWLDIWDELQKLKEAHEFAQAVNG